MPLNIHKCLRCGYEWASRKLGLPQTCAKCRSPYWNKPKWKQSGPVRKADLIRDDNNIIGGVLPIGNIHAHQVKNGWWRAYLVAEDHPKESEIRKSDREHWVKEDMDGRHVWRVKDVNGIPISGATKEELIENERAFID